MDFLFRIPLLVHCASVGRHAGYPDFLDLDGDGDKEESMKKAAKDKEKEMDEGEVIGVDSNIRKQRMMKESYKAVSAKPSRDSWGNEYNKILTESSQVEGIKSLMERMKK